MSPTPAHGIVTDTKQTEQTVAADGDGGGVHGASTIATGCNLDYGIIQKNDYWVLFPERHEAALQKEIKSKGIGVTILQVNTIKPHEPYQE